MKHKKRTIITIALCFILMINSESINVKASKVDDQQKINQETEKDVWPEAPKILAKSAIVMDVDSGTILYEKNSKEANYPASITKILTTLVAVENSALSETVTFSKDAVFNIERGSSLCGIDWGEKLSLEDCLYGVMLESGNEAAYAVAEHVGGSFDHFVEMMNERATELGCVNSHFANPHGLSQEDHYTCAYDMALISRAAIKNTAFKTITGTRRHQVDPTNKQPETRYFLNHHKFIKGDLKYEGCIGGKTGWTTKSKYTLVTYAKRGNMTLLCVIMNEEDPKAQYTDTAELLDYGFDNFSLYNVSNSKQSELIQDAFFQQCDTPFNAEKPLLCVEGGSYVLLPNGVDVSKIQTNVTFSENKVEESNTESIIEVGTVTYSYLGQTVGEGKVIMDLSEGKLPTTIHKVIDSSSSNQKKANRTEQTKQEKSKHKNIKPLIIGAIILVIALIFVLHYLMVERPRRRRRKAYLARRRNRRYYD